MEESIDIVVNKDEFHNLAFSEKEEIMKKKFIEIKEEIQISQSELDVIINSSKPVPASAFLNFFGNFLSNVIGNIPVVGPLAGALFSTIWDEVFTRDDSAPGMPPQPRFLTADEFHEYMAEFRRDMERLINQRIDDLIIATSNSLLLDLKFACDRWHEVIAWFEQEVGQGRHKSSIPPERVPGYLKKGLPAGSEQFRSWELNAIRAEIVNRHGHCIVEMNRCMNYFTTVGGGIENRQLMAGHVIQTCCFYIMIQRDVFFKGSEWGFFRQQINVIPSQISIFIDRAFGSFSSIAMPNFRNGTFLTKLNTPELYRIYSTFAYLDLIRFPVTAKKLDINPINHVLTIPEQYNDNRIKIVVNQHGASRHIPATPIIPKDILMEGVYDCDNWSALGYNYTVRRPSRTFTRVTVRVAHTGGAYSSFFRVFINDQQLFHTTSTLKDMYFYNGSSQSVYLSVTHVFNSPTTEFTIRFGANVPNEFSNHSIIEFEQ
ncbi:hypothetical protein ACTFIU_006966 [Dictyostelium citrinum]